MANPNKTQCDCFGFYDAENSGCIPYDETIHLEEPCPSSSFVDFFSGISQDQWIGGTNFGIQMCQLFGGCGNMGAGSYSDPNSQAYLMYIKEERKRTNTIIIIGLLISAGLFYAAYKNK